MRLSSSHSPYVKPSIPRYHSHSPLVLTSSMQSQDDRGDQLPAYSSTSAWIRTPAGEGGAGPLVSVGHVKGHLAILRAVAKMKEGVISGEIGGDGKADEKDKGKGKEGEKRWGWFVSMAVERYVYFFISH